jgi:hypothetical protein
MKLTLVPPPPPGPFARIARLFLDRGWTAATAYALFEGMGASPEFPAGIAAAMTVLEAPRRPSRH